MSMMIHSLQFLFELIRVEFDLGHGIKILVSLDMEVIFSPHLDDQVTKTIRIEYLSFFDCSVQWFLPEIIQMLPRILRHLHVLVGFETILI